jgi:hypothetical protein
MNQQALEPLKQRYFSLQRPSDDPARDGYLECFDFLACGWLGSEKIRGVEDATKAALEHLYQALDRTEGPYLEAIEEHDQQEREYWQKDRQRIYLKIGVLTDLLRRLAQAKQAQEEDRRSEP